MNELERKSLIARLAALRQDGKSVLACSKELDVKRYWVEKILESQEYKDYLDKLRNEIESEIVAFEAEKHKQLSAKLWALDTKVIKTIEQNLDDGKIQAVEAWAKLAIRKDRADKEQADTSIQIIMPGAEQPKAIEAEYTKKEESDEQV